MTFRTAFPAFPADAIPTLPAGFEDVSWHNDACPSFLNEAAGRIVFVDHPNAGDRDIPEAPRFSVSAYDDGTGDVLFSSDDWAEVLAFLSGSADRLALAFARQLAEDIGDETDLATAIERNASPEYQASGACASHDFCDANMTMHAAWLATFDAEPGFLRGEDHPDAASSLALWNAAWALARSAAFYTVNR